MGRIILILTAACLIATFMIISNFSLKTATTASPKAGEVTKKPEKERPTKRAQSSRAERIRKAPVDKSRSYKIGYSEDSQFDVVSKPEEETSHDFEHAIIKGDYAPVYSVNSRDGKIVGLLKKGDRVSTGVEVLDGQGRWTVVEKGKSSRPRYVLDQNL